MRSLWAAAFGMWALAACAATPDLVFAPADGGGGGPDSTVPGEDATTGPDAVADGGADVVNPGDTGVDAGRDSQPPVDAPADVVIDTFVLCPSVDAADSGCCQSIDRTCVGASCAHCQDCQNAACNPTDFCCPTFNGGGMYKGTECKPTLACN